MLRYWFLVLRREVFVARARHLDGLCVPWSPYLLELAWLEHVVAIGTPHSAGHSCAIPEAYLPNLSAPFSCHRGFRDLMCISHIPRTRRSLQCPLILVFPQVCKPVPSPESSSINCCRPDQFHFSFHSLGCLVFHSEGIRVPTI